MAESKDGFRITGTTSGRTEDGTTQRMLHEFAVDVSPAGVRVAMTGMGGGTHDAISEPSADVRRHWREVRALQDRTAYANRPIVSDWKAAPAKKAKKATPAKRPKLVVCPACLGRDYECAFCDGTFAVTPRQAEQWEIDQARGGRDA